jgi:hypothetical protein
MRGSSLDEKAHVASPNPSSPAGEKTADVISNSDSNGKPVEEEAKEDDKNESKASIRDYAVRLCWVQLSDDIG